MSNYKENLYQIFTFLFSGDILEIGAQWAIARHEIPAFERYMAQLKCYYMDYKYVAFHEVEIIVLSKFLLVKQFVNMYQEIDYPS